MARPYIKDAVLFGERVRRIRLKKGMTQIELAGHCDIDVITIKRIEKGTSNPILSTVFAIAKALEVEARELF